MAPALKTAGTESPSQLPERIQGRRDRDGRPELVRADRARERKAAISRHLPAQKKRPQPMRAARELQMENSPRTNELADGHSHKFNAFVADSRPRSTISGADEPEVLLTTPRAVAANAVQADITVDRGRQPAYGGRHQATLVSVGARRRDAMRSTQQRDNNGPPGAIGPFRYCVLYNSTPPQRQPDRLVHYGNQS